MLRENAASFYAFSEIPWKPHIFLSLTEGSIAGRMLARRLSFFGGKSIRDYFMGKLGPFWGSFCVCRRISNDKNYQFINQSDIIKY